MEVTHDRARPAAIRDARRYGDGSVYVVAWPSAGFYKVGFAVDERRWRSYRPRGGRLLLWLTPLTRHASVLEPEMHRLLTEGGAVPAFAAKRDAAPFLGHGGAGWTECYRGDGTAAVPVLAAECLRWSSAQ